MKNLVNRFLQLDKTKRIVILFITISFVFIFGFGIYNSSFNNHSELDNEIVNVDESDVANLESDLSSDLKTTEDKQGESTKESHQEDNPEENIEESNQKENQKNDSTKQSQKSNENSNTQKNQTVVSQKKKENTSQESSQKNKEPSQNKEGQTNQKDDAVENKQTETTDNNVENKNEKEDSLSINMKVTGIDETMMRGQLNVKKGTNVYEALVKLASQNGKTVSGSSSYVTGIGGLNEKDHGPLSGWMYKVNNVVPNRSAGSYELEDGDNVVWFYVNYK